MSRPPLPVPGDVALHDLVANLEDHDLEAAMVELGIPKQELTDQDRAVSASEEQDEPLRPEPKCAYAGVVARHLARFAGAHDRPIRSGRRVSHNDAEYRGRQRPLPPDE
jgi:hypothetical protein